VSIVGSTISGNSAGSGGVSGGEGAGAKIIAGASATVVIEDSLFDGNSGDTDNLNHGAGIYLELEGFAIADVRDSTLSNNSWDFSAPSSYSSTDGAYLRANDDSTLVVERCAFIDNRSPNADTPGQLTMVTRDDSAGVVADSLFTGGYWGVRVAESENSDLYLSHLTVTNNDRSVRFSCSGGGGRELNNSVLSGNGVNQPELIGGPNSLYNLIGSNPTFVDPTNGNYHLLPGSPATDSGNAARPGVRSLDLDGSPRVFGAETDQGAYEWGWMIFADGFETGDMSAWE
jgi:hypothetical protein